MDIRDRLDEHFAAERVAMPRPDLGAVMERGEEIKRRRRVVAGGLSVAAVAAVVVGVMALGSQLDENPNLAADNVAAGGAVLNADSDLTWEIEPATLGWTTQRHVESDGTIYVLSTAPGTTWAQFPNGNIPQAIYTSTDGTDWASQPLGFAVASIAVRDDILYTISTAPGTSEESANIVVSRSSDGGETFAATELPAPAGLANAFIDARLAVTGGGVLAFSSSTTFMDPSSLVPPALLDQGHDPLFSDAGLAVLESDDGANVAAFEEACSSGDEAVCTEFVEANALYWVTWDELGVTKDEAAMGGEIRRSSAYWSQDGAEFTRVEYPFPIGWIDQVFQVGDSAVVSVAGNQGVGELLASSDGSNWKRLEGLAPMSWMLEIGELGDEIVVVSMGPDGQQVQIQRAPDLNGPWEMVSMDGVVPTVDGQESFMWVLDAAVSDQGVALSVGVEAAGGSSSDGFTGLMRRVVGRPAPEGEADRGMEPLSALLTSPDLQTWSLTTSDEIGGPAEMLMFAPSGELIAHTTNFENGRSSRFQATARP